MSDCQNIGFLGGTFDPFHLGHLNFAIEILEKTYLDEIWICPTSISPFKTKTPPVNASHRLEMVLGAIESIKGLRVLDVEAHAKEASYTYETLVQLEKENLGVKMHLVLSQELISSLHLWKNARALLERFPLFVGSIQKEDMDLGGLPSWIVDKIKGRICQIRCFEVSSREVRERFKKNLYCDHLLPSKTLDYIYKHKLYS